MELTLSANPQECLLIGLEEIYSESPQFAQLRHALSKGSSRQRLYDILSVAATFSEEHSSFIIKMREALDRPFNDEFWTWFARAMDALDNSSDNIELINRTLKRNSPADFNVGLLGFLLGPADAHKDLLRAVKNALEHRRKNYFNEALRIFEIYEAPPYQFLQRVRRSFNQESPVEKTLQILGAFENFPEYQWLGGLKRGIKLADTNFEFDSLSRSQIQSKRWATQHIYEIFGPDLREIHILCGWYGLLGVIMQLSGLFPNLSIRSYDIDPACMPIADAVNTQWLLQSWRFKAFTEDIYKIDYGNAAGEGLYSPVVEEVTGRNYRSRNDLIVNASCEHLSDFKGWFDKIPSGTALVLQSNNGFGEDGHVNCVRDLAEFKKMAPLQELRYAGALDCGVFTRFMLIGLK